MASARIGGAGPITGQPVFFHWPWYWHLSRIGVWALLVLAVIVPPRNRHRHALLIFIPLAILALLWPLVARSLTIPSTSLDQFSLLFESLVTGFGLMWLNADVLRRQFVLVRVPLSLATLVLAAFVALASCGRWPPDPLAVILPIFAAVLGTILLTALAVARRLTHRRYAPVPFLLWLAAGCLLLTPALVAVLAVVMWLLSPQGTFNAGVFFVQVTVGLALGACLYAVNLPYLLLMFRSPFFRRRFQQWLGVESLPPQGQGANPEGRWSRSK